MMQLFLHKMVQISDNKMLRGTGQFLTFSTLSTTKPRYLISFWKNAHFKGLNLNPALNKLPKLGLIYSWLLQRFPCNTSIVSSILDNGQASTFVISLIFQRSTQNLHISYDFLTITMVLVQGLSLETTIPLSNIFLCTCQFLVEYVEKLSELSI